MLTIPTCLGKSHIHGYGCFTSEPLEVGTVVWVFHPEVDRILDGKASHWERLHAYGSNARGGRLVLCGDNAAWMNFGNPANLIEAEEIKGEYCLRTATDIRAYTELTVPLASDTDSQWKLQTMEGVKCIRVDIS